MLPTRILALLLLLVLAGCAHPQPIPYPKSPAGLALQNFYTDAPDAEKALAWLHGATEPGNPAAPPAITPADRAALQPAMLAILRHDDSAHALQIALLLTQWEFEQTRPTAPADLHRLLPASAPEFRRLLPAIIRGLDAPNDPDPNGTQNWSSLGSTMILLAMGPDATYPHRDAIARRFNAPVTAKIEGESNECWERTWLGAILVTFGSDGVPGLVPALDHSDPMVREIALMALHAIVAPGTEEMFASHWGDSPAHQAAARIAARSAAPKVIDRLWDSDMHVRDRAAGLLPLFMDRSALTPRVRDRLLAMLVVGDGEPNDGAAAALAGFHPTFTPALLDYLDNSEDPHYYGAVQALETIGRPIIPDLIARLAAEKEPSSPGPSEVLNRIGPAALAELAKAAFLARDSATRHRITDCLNQIAKDAYTNVAAVMPRLEEPVSTTHLADIRTLCENAPVAGPALPALECLAAHSPDAAVRAAAKSAIEQINREKLNLAPTP